VRGGRLTGDTWMRRQGDDETAEWPRSGTSADGSLVCDQAGCILRREGMLISLVERVDGLAEDCRNADLVISLVFARRICRDSKAQVIDALDLRRDGAYALWLTPSGLTRRSVRDDRGERPWTKQPN
jgi:competence protein ComEC